MGMRLLAPLIAFTLLTLLVPSASAASCPDVVVWATDDAKDVYDLPENLNGGMDILELRVGQAGAECDRVVVGVTINDPLVVDPALGSGEQDPEQPFNVGSQRVIVTLGALADESPVEVHFVWAIRTHAEETSHEGWWVELHVAGQKISDTGAGDNAKLSDEDDGGIMDASIARSALPGISGWSGATAAAHEWGHDAYHGNGGPGYAPDTLVAEEPFTFDYGLGTPPVEEVPILNETVPAVNETGNDTTPEQPPADDPEPSGNDCPDGAGCGAKPADNATVDDAPPAKESPGLALPTVLAVLATLGMIRLRRR